MRKKIFGGIFSILLLIFITIGKNAKEVGSVIRNTAPEASKVIKGAAKNADEAAIPIGKAIEESAKEIAQKAQKLPISTNETYLKGILKNQYEAFTGDDWLTQVYAKTLSIGDYYKKYLDFNSVYDDGKENYSQKEFLDALTRCMYTPSENTDPWKCYEFLLVEIKDQKELYTYATSESFLSYLTLEAHTANFIKKYSLGFWSGKEFDFEQLSKEWSSKIPLSAFFKQAVIGKLTDKLVLRNKIKQELITLAQNRSDALTTYEATKLIEEQFTIINQEPNYINSGLQGYYEVIIAENNKFEALKVSRKSPIPETAQISSPSNQPQKGEAIPRKGVINATQVIVRESHSTLSDVITSIEFKGEIVQILDVYTGSNKNQGILTKDFTVTLDGKTYSLLKNKAVSSYSRTNDWVTIAFKDKIGAVKYAKIQAGLVQDIDQAPWYKILRNDGTIGWVYGKFVSTD